MEYIDRSLVHQVQQGDRKAFAELVDIYKDKIYHLAFRMLNSREEAEDVAQDTFLRVYENIQKYDEGYKVSTWIYRIATNLCIDRIRKKKADVSLDETHGGEDGSALYARLPSAGPTPEAEVIEGEQKGEIHQAIQSLPAKYRAVVLLKYIEELSLQEISEATGLPVSTVKTRIHRGREALRKKLRHI